MKNKSVYVTRRIPEIGLEMLSEKFDVEINPEDRVLSKEEIIENMEECDALLCLLTDDIDGELMDSNPNLKIIANYAVGYNNIDVEAASERDIIVSNTPGVLTETTADMAWVMLMASARRIVESDKFLRAGKYKGWAPKLLLGTDVYGKSLGIIGLGRIGRAIARRAQGFGIDVLYYDPYRLDEEKENELDVTYCSMETLLEKSDFVSINALLTEETHHLISREEFKLMKNTAILVNVARGPIVNEDELVKALKEKEIAGAALDVFEEEPKVHPELIEMDNVVLTPHTASATIETRSKMARIAVENIIAVLEGNEAPNKVND
jgi:glyoxylate reductase